MGVSGCRHFILCCCCLRKHSCWVVVVLCPLIFFTHVNVIFLYVQSMKPDALAGILARVKETAASTAKAHEDADKANDTYNQIKGELVDAVEERIRADNRVDRADNRLAIAEAELQSAKSNQATVEAKVQALTATLAEQETATNAAYSQVGEAKYEERTASELAQSVTAEIDEATAAAELQLEALKVQMNSLKELKQLVQPLTPALTQPRLAVVAPFIAPIVAPIPAVVAPVVVVAKPIVPAAVPAPIPEVVVAKSIVPAAVPAPIPEVVVAKSILPAAVPAPILEVVVAKSIVPAAVPAPIPEVVVVAKPTVPAAVPVSMESPSQANLGIVHAAIQNYSDALVAKHLDGISDATQSPMKLFEWIANSYISRNEDSSKFVTDMMALLKLEDGLSSVLELLWKGYKNTAEAAGKVHSFPSHNGTITPADVGRRCAYIAYANAKHNGIVKFVGYHPISGVPCVAVHIDDNQGKSNGQIGIHRYFGPVGEGECIIAKPKTIELGYEEDEEEMKEIDHMKRWSLSKKLIEEEVQAISKQCKEMGCASFDTNTHELCPKHAHFQVNSAKHKLDEPTEPPAKTFKGRKLVMVGPIDGENPPTCPGCNSVDDVKQGGLQIEHGHDGNIIFSDKHRYWVCESCDFQLMVGIDSSIESPVVCSSCKEHGHKNKTNKLCKNWKPRKAPVDGFCLNKKKK